MLSEAHTYIQLLLTIKVACRCDYTGTLEHEFAPAVPVLSWRGLRCTMIQSLTSQYMACIVALYSSILDKSNAIYSYIYVRPVPFRIVASDVCLLLWAEER